MEKKEDIALPQNREELLEMMWAAIAVGLRNPRNAQIIERVRRGDERLLSQQRN
ncbi:MAG: hypothetical protein HYV45_00540 [Candidatus Moranbacteria bacterium]|nr:hypothetical protein [Candidatus Moranbacteria bacterium]